MTKDPIKIKAAASRYYHKNKEAYRLRGEAQRQRAFNFVWQYKAEHPCSCTESRPAALDFHHRDPSTKYKEISVMVRNGSSIPAIIKEIAKCDILCKNCHAVYHHNEKSLAT